MNQHEKLNYVEFAVNDLESTKAFFSKTFGWSFVDLQWHSEFGHLVRGDIITS